MKAVAIVLTTLFLAACARPLRPPPPLRELAPAGSPHGASERALLLSKAEGLFSRRTLEDARRAESLWLEADGDGKRIEGLLGAARAAAWLADHETQPAARLAAATKALEAAQWCAKIEPTEPACDYWLGVGLGLQARERPSTGLLALPKIVEAFRAAAAAAPALDEAGPDRALALVYLRAPGWPAGPGDPDEGLTHARRAVTLAPAHPPNLLALAEALSATGDAEGSRKVRAEALQRAKDRAAAGDPDAADWVAEVEKEGKR
jgi:hypothetical protein